MCLKILYDLYGDALGDAAGPPVLVELTDFRQDAVATGLAILERHNGCCIADVVGRGKTCIGAEIRRRLAIKDPRPATRWWSARPGGRRCGNASATGSGWTTPLWSA